MVELKFTLPNVTSFLRDNLSGLEKIFRPGLTLKKRRETFENGRFPELYIQPVFAEFKKILT